MSDSIADTDMNDISTGETGSNPQATPEEVPEKTGGSWLDRLKAEAPPDDGSYESHALNFDGKKSTSKIIRGAEGILGDMNKAVLLILIGLLEKFNENMDSEAEDTENPEEQETGEETGFGVDLK